MTGKRVFFETRPLSRGKRRNGGVREYNTRPANKKIRAQSLFVVLGPTNGARNLLGQPIGHNCPFGLDWRAF